LKRLNAIISRSRLFFLNPGLTGLIVIIVLTVATSGCNMQNIATSENSQSPALSGIRGQLVYRSDVETMPDYPVTKGLILAIPESRFKMLLKETEVSYWDGNDGNIGFMHFQITRPLFESYVQASSALSNRGEYELPLQPGKFVLGAGNLDIQNPHDFPVRIVGCVVVEIVQNKFIEVKIGVGEGVGIIHR
jgi:hypothetical protein